MALLKWTYPIEAKKPAKIPHQCVFTVQGVGHVRIEPMPNVTVDVYVTHTAANDYNSYYREIQVRIYR